jgi:hypothetical protein
MKSDRSLEGKRQPWIPPTVAKLAIGTETKSPVSDEKIAPGSNESATAKNAEPQPPATPAMKFGFSLEWSLPLSTRND